MIFIYGCAVDTGTSVTESDIKNLEQETCETPSILFGCSSASIVGSEYVDMMLSSSSTVPTKTLNLGTDIVVSNFYLNNGGIKIAFRNNRTELLYVNIDYTFKCKVNDWQKGGTFYLSLHEYETKESIISYVNYCKADNDYGIITLTAMRPSYETAKEYLTWHGEYTYYSTNYK